MKKILLTVMAAMAVLTLDAQNIYVGGSLGFWNNDNSNTTTFNIAPEVGYAINEQWTIGGSLSYSLSSAKNNIDNSTYHINSFGVSPYARYTFLSEGIVSIFVDGILTFNINKTGKNDAVSGVALGIRPGIALKLTDRISLVSHVGNIGMGTKNSNNAGFGLKLNSYDLSLGVYYNF